jgi:GTP cyclohydrolase I
MRNESQLTALFADILCELGLDLSDPNLLNTPQRLAKMYLDLFENVGKDFLNFTTFPNNDKKYDQIILSDKIFFSSMCAHHFMPFMGRAWIMYIPNQQLIGASKMVRLVHHYAKRPQIQEQLTHDILNQFVKHIEPQGAMVVLKAVHGCMVCRGVKQEGAASMVTSAIYGCFSQDSIRNEAFNLMNLSSGIQALG